MLNNKLLLLSLFLLCFSLNVSCSRRKNSGNNAGIENSGGMYKRPGSDSIAAVNPVPGPERRFVVDETTTEIIGKDEAGMDVRRKRKKRTIDEEDRDGLRSALSRVILGDKYFNLKIGDLIVQSIWAWLTHIDGGDIFGGVTSKDPKKKKGIGSLIGQLVCWGAGTTILGGAANSLQKTVEKVSDMFLGFGVTSVVKLINKIYRVFWHRNAEKLNKSIILCWKKEMEDIHKKLKEVAHQSFFDGELGQKLKLRQFQRIDSNTSGNSDNSNNSSKSEAKKVINLAWEENKLIYLSRILNIVTDVMEHRKYYENHDKKIIRSIDDLIRCLIGNQENFALDDNYYYSEEDEDKVGGIYGAILKTKDISDLSTPIKKSALEMFHGNVQGVLNRLGNWVEQEGSIRRRESSNYNSYNSYGSRKSTSFD